MSTITKTIAKTLPAAFCIDDTDTVTDFAAGAGGDLLRLQNFDFVSFDSFKAALTQQGADTLVTLSGGQVLTLKNVTALSLTIDNVVFGHTLAASGAATNWVAKNGSTISGTAGNDSFGAAANTVFVGGAGDDVYGVSSISQNITFVEKAGEGIDTVNSWISFTLSNDQAIENLTLFGAGNLTATGNDLDNRITGNTGNNVIAGGNGNDVLTGGGGRDTFVITKGGGLDTITDFAATGDGADTIRLDHFGYMNFVDLKSVMTQAGGDTVLWLGPQDTVVLKNAKAADLTSANFSFTGVIAPVPDTAAGGHDTFMISKASGSGVIADFAAGAGGDLLRLQNFDFVSFDSFKAALTQQGADTLVTLSGGQVLTLKNVTALSLTIDNVVFGHTLAASGAATNWVAKNGSTISGTAGNDSFGAAANTVFVGGAGDDVYGVSSISQNITFVEKAGEGIDTVNSWISFTLSNDQAIENLTLFGAGNLTATGNDLDNRITGNTGNNVIAGGNGNDVLTGGGGRDTFVITKGGGLDTITDFAATGDGADTIRLDHFGYMNFVDLKSVMTQAGGDTVLWLGPQDAVVLKNVKAADLTSANFDFTNVVAPVPEPPVQVDTTWQSGPDIVGTKSADALKGTALAEYIDGRAGNDALTGSSGRDTFVISMGNGSDTITDFAAGSGGDYLRMQNYGFKDFSSFRKASAQSGAPIR
ncbi:Ca2+-binding RTX toxin-like protein [Bradyrhizobium sp. LB9.1b]